MFESASRKLNPDSARYRSRFCIGNFSVCFEDSFKNQI
jgi:hypothetical protein